MSSNASKTGAQIVVESLERHGVTHVFGIPGAKIDKVFDTLKSSSIETVVCRHEQNAGPPKREDSVELRETEVVADRQSQLDAAGALRRDDLAAGRLVLGLQVGDSVDGDIEHVDLAVNRADLAVR